MDKGVAVALMVIAGGMIALQAPINSTLGKHVGTFAAASISFAVGTIALVGITVLVGGGFGEVSGGVREIAPYYLIGGLLGAVYVTTALVMVRTIGVGGVTAATIAGQLVLAMVLDRLGAFGLEERPLSVQRILGIALLVAGTILVVRE